MKMEQYELQSYFKSLCNSFYIAYQQEKRLKKERDEINFEDKTEDLEMIDYLLNCNIQENVQNRYISTKYSQEELQREKERLEALEEEYEREYNEWEDKIHEWQWKKRRIADEIERIVEEIAEKKYTVIVTSEAEIYALMYFYASNHSVEKYPIINREEQYLKLFPKGNAVYIDFLTAYHYDLTTCTNNGSKMKEVYYLYF